MRAGSPKLAVYDPKIIKKITFVELTVRSRKYNMWFTGERRKRMYINQTI